MIERQEEEYRKYINEHIQNVKRAYEEYGVIVARTLGLYSKEETDLLKNINVHDISKFSESEFDGYRQYFYPFPGMEKDEMKYNKAWLQHIHHNPHHPEHWVLPQDADASKNIILDMPRVYIVEMILDWIAMGYKFNSKVYDWYEKEKDKKPLSEFTRVLVERCMKALKEADGREVK